MRTRTGLLLSVLLLLAGCITVGSFGPYWDSGTIDPGLNGKWNSVRETGGYGVEFTQEDKLYRMHYENTDDKFVRTLKVGDSTYLMMKKNESDEGGTLLAYVLQGDDLVFFAPNRDKQKEFLARYPNIPFTITKTSFTIEQLTPETMKWLTQITGEPEWWTEIQRFARDK